MNFIDPKTSFAFQRIFGTPAHREIALSFFNALLSPRQPAIASLAFFTPEQLDRAFGYRESNAIVAQANYEDGSAAIIDAKILNLPTFGKRLLFEAAKTYCSQLSQNRQSPEMLPVIALNILDFELFGSEANLISHFAFGELEQQFAFPDRELSLVFVELPKFTKPVAALESVTEYWLYFLRHAPQLTEVPAAIAAVPPLQQAFALADDSQLTRQELDILQQQLLAIADQRQSVDVGLAEGLRQGVEQGRRQGQQEGIVQGIEEGRKVGIEEGRQAGIEEGIVQGKQVGIRQGRLEGLQAGQFNIVRRLLSRRFGPLEAPIATKLEKLSTPQLESLAEAAWDFITEDELAEWLDRQA